MPIIYLAILAVLESKIIQKIWDKSKCPTQHVSKPSNDRGNDEALQLEKSIIHHKIQTLKKSEYILNV